MNQYTELEAAKRCVWDALQALAGPDAAAAAAQVLTPGSEWVVSHPVNALAGPGEVVAQFITPLHRALPDLEWRPDLFFAGHWDGRVDGGAGVWVTTTGHWLGTFTQPLWGIPASAEPAWLRYGGFFRVVDGRIAEGRLLLDLVDLARQAGCPVLPASTGQALLVPGPRTRDGVLLSLQDPDLSAASLALVEAMIGGLGRYDRNDLKSMGMGAFWRPDMMWYGPGGIGSSRGIGGFERHHQKPFLTAFPDRKGGNHRARFAEGHYVASTGWPSVRATHAGPYLGEPASGGPITMRVMDWWRAQDGLLAENWVLIDLPHLFLQFGVDLLARAADPSRAVKR
ncbi:ester cyclase [Roseateles toxinivorans]|uniref:SnoaL-like protein n=1 Tax=Roseateles toxinivorans TaxID=270368 RepID=A0A4V3CSN2_9BURK|nr:ester cyclase [Roseateles toxinivorans]TDP61282.1 SnoaL-like protein [Roseateles toxinivorans]